MPDESHLSCLGPEFLDPDLVEGQLTVLVELSLNRQARPRFVIVYLEGAVRRQHEPVNDSLARVARPLGQRELDIPLQAQDPSLGEGLMASVIVLDEPAAREDPILSIPII